MTDKQYVFVQDGQIIIDFMYEPPPPPEFRLYYDENGNVLFYTGDKPEGNYIVIDNTTFAEARHDVRVIDGKIIYNSNILQVYKVKPSDNGTLTSTEDVCLILDNEQEGQRWDLATIQLIKD